MHATNGYTYRNWIFFVGTDLVPVVLRAAIVIPRNIAGPLTRRIAATSRWVMDQKAYAQDRRQPVPRDCTASEGDWPNASL